MKIKKENPKPYVILELRNSTFGQKKEIKTISLEYDELHNVLNDVLGVSKILKPDLSVVAHNVKGKPKHKQLSIVSYYKISQKSGKSKTVSLYGFTVSELYNKIIEIYGN